MRTRLSTASNASQSQAVRNPQTYQPSCKKQTSWQHTQRQLPLELLLCSSLFLQAAPQLWTECASVQCIVTITRPCLVPALPRRLTRTPCGTLDCRTSSQSHAASGDTFTTHTQYTMRAQYMQRVQTRSAQRTRVPMRM